MSLRIAKVEDKTLANQFIFGNKLMFLISWYNEILICHRCAVSPQDFPEMEENTDFLLLLNGNFILTVRSINSFQPGCISLSDPQRTWLSVGLMDQIVAEYYDPRQESSNYLLGYTELEVGFASLKKVTDVPIDQDDLEARFLDQFDNQFLTVGQKIIMDYKSLLLSFVVRACDVVPVMLEDKTVTKDKGKLNSKTHITFFKDAKSILKLKGSARRPATNSIVGPNFKFENMGIGGLDKEFSQLFRRAFASRVFPPDVIQDMGIQHVKGILLYGPPGTGKTLIARQIGKMLNAREPKIINGPEVLNKFVGQSEENIRKLFADAEKEYKEKGDESGLHIIIFDELDAVCKQRGSGAGGGTGVGDSVVNQLLSKLDGVEPLNNILLIGMTNRKDMIDDALLRPGRIEVQLEIMLPDEFGRLQILKIHLAKMVASKVLGDDVDVEDLASRTKNFSGAEIAGLVKSASSYALNRHIVVGTQAQIDDNLANIKVTAEDFNEALKEVKPAFGRADESLEKAAPFGIVHFGPHIQHILNQGQTQIASLKRVKRGSSVASLLLSGPMGAGRTALAAKIAGDSGFPFVKYVKANDLNGMVDSAKADYVKKAFTDAYKSPQSVIILDDIERLISWIRMGPLFSSAVVQTLMVQLSNPPPTVSQKCEFSNLDLI